MDAPPPGAAVTWSSLFGRRACHEEVVVGWWEVRVLLSCSKMLKFKLPIVVRECTPTCYLVKSLSQTPPRNMT